MPIGSRAAGVATGPRVGPRDPTTLGDPGAGAPQAPGRAGGSVDLVIVRYDEKLLTGTSGGAFDTRLYWQPTEQQGDLILIDRIVVAHDTLSDPITTIFWSTSDANWNNSLYKFDFTEAPRNVAEYNPPVILPASQRIIVTTGLGVSGDRSNIHFWYRVGRLI